MQVTHICLIGEDPTANLTPIIDKDIPSDRVIVAHEAHQVEQFEQLKKVIQTRGYKVEAWLLPITLNTAEIKLNFMELFDRESTHQSETWLNASNGSRYQVLSAFEVARGYNASIYIVEPKYDALCWLYPENKPISPIADKIKLHEFLSVNGCIVTDVNKNSIVERSYKSISENWLKQANKLNTGLAKLNYLAQAADDNEALISPTLDKAMLNDESLQWLLNDLEALELISIKENKVHFKSEQTRFFANGGWLEDITYTLANSLKRDIPEIQDIGHSVEVKRTVGNKTIRNELDVAILVDNKLYVIECKTKRYQHSDGTNVLYKLDSIAERLGGLKCNSALITYFPLNNAEKARARELGITIVNIQSVQTFELSLFNLLNIKKRT